MHFDRIDESYAMVKSNIHFDKVTLTSQTGLCIPVRPVYTVCQFWYDNFSLICLSCISSLLLIAASMDKHVAYLRKEEL